MKKLLLLLVCTATTASVWGMEQKKFTTQPISHVGEIPLRTQLHSYMRRVAQSWHVRKQRKLDEKFTKAIVTYLAQSENKQLNLSRIKSLIMQRASVNNSSGYNRQKNFTLLYRAVAYDDLSLVNLLLEHGAGQSVNVPHLPHNFLPLTHAIHNENLPMTQALINHGAASSINLSYNIRDVQNDQTIFRPSDITSLHLAMNTQNIKLVRFLFEHGAAESVNVKAQGWTPLHVTSNPEIKKLLLLYGAEPMKKDGTQDKNLAQLQNELAQEYAPEIAGAETARAAVLQTHIPVTSLVTIVQKLSPLTFKDVVVARHRAEAQERVEKIKEQLRKQNETSQK
jgi:hypothetical protein